MAGAAAHDRHWGVLGVPSSRAAHGPGLERGPAALRSAGLVEALAAAGASVTDHGDRPVARWRDTAATGVARPQDEAHDVAGVAEVLRDARDALDGLLAAGETPLVLGGECTLVVPLVAAAVRAHGDIGLVHVDGGQDLQLTADHPEEPILDSGGVAHLLDLPGAAAELAGLGGRRPLLAADALCFLGFADDDEDVHGLVPSLRLPAVEVVADPEGAAARAVEAVTGHASTGSASTGNAPTGSASTGSASTGNAPTGSASTGRAGARDHAGPGGRRFVVHLDVDVLDALLLPGADIPQYGRGLTLDVLVAALEPLVADPRFAGMTLVEYNPDHDPDGASARRLVAALAPVLAARREP